MRFRRTLNFHSLKKGRARQTWNKYNLFNLSKLQRTFPNFIKRTFFQQKWTAKALTRAYHGEHIKERKWERMFSRRLLSVTNMDPHYMAHHDGSEQAAGRGSGKDTYTDVDRMPWRGDSTAKNIQGSILQRQDAFDEDEAVIKDYGAALVPNRQLFGTGRTPYMNMTYAPLERRIDVAIHRALFASSTRQARQFVVHGLVKVNGQVMTHPSYLLNPGDMFQVDRESVLFATGKKKATVVAAAEKAEEAVEEAAEEKADAEADAEAEAEKKEKKDPKAPISAERMTQVKANQKLRYLSQIAREVLKDDAVKLTARKKRHLRNFIQGARSTMSLLGRDDPEKIASADIVKEINKMLTEMTIQKSKIATDAEASGAFSAVETAGAKAAADAVKAAEQNETPKTDEDKRKIEKAAAKRISQHQLSQEEMDRFEQNLQMFRDNPWDPTKRYHTPWEPRPYMAPFAFIPRYLEVNQNICAAVYLRHPVARRDQAEVPSPFPPNIMQLAFNWYLRRR